MTRPANSSETPTTKSSPVDVEATPVWSIAAAGIWVGRNAGVSIGVIEEKWRQGFVAIDRNARRLGVFPTLDEAKAYFSPSSRAGVDDL